MEWICSRCGCSSYHYNRARLRNECNGCGFPLVDHQQEQQRLQYDRTLSQAQNHLLAGNWSQVISLINPLMDQNPSDKQLYRMALRAATKDLSDFGMGDSAMRAAASAAWTKLVRLKGLEEAMLRYSRARYEEHLKELRIQKNKILLWIFLASGCSIAAVICHWQSLHIGSILLLCGLVASLYQAAGLRPIATTKKLSYTTPKLTDNPFS